MTLHHQNEIKQMADNDWRAVLYEQLHSRLALAYDFPCIFAQRSIRRELALLAFVTDLTDASLDASLADLREFVEVSRGWDGNATSARPLLMMVSPEAFGKSGATLDEYHEAGWRILQYWHDHDQSDWPKEVGREPASPYWTMCFSGMQIFVNMSCPAHVNRRSRNLGDSLCLVINPRERFDLVAGDCEGGRRMRTFIRDRIAVYDGMPHSPQLGSYQAGEIEWWQYGVLDENRPRMDRCPFKMRDD